MLGTEDVVNRLLDENAELELIIQTITALVERAGPAGLVPVDKLARALDGISARGALTS